MILTNNLCEIEKNFKFRFSLNRNSRLHNPAKKNVEKVCLALSLSFGVSSAQTNIISASVFRLYV